MQLQKLTDEISQVSRQLPRSSSCFFAHVTYICSSTLGIAVQRHRGKQSIPASSLPTLENAAQHQNEHRMTAERVPFIRHTLLMDPDALNYAERTIQSIAGRCSGGRSFVYTNAFVEDFSTPSQTPMMVMQIALTREGVVSSYKMGIRSHWKMQCKSHRYTSNMLERTV